MSLAAGPLASAPTLPRPPATRVEVVRETLHGVEIEDPYRWLEDGRSPETRAWIEAQRAYTESVLASLPGREAVESRLRELMRIDAIGVPTGRNGRYFFARRRIDQELFVLYVRDGLRGRDRVLVDPHRLSVDLTRSVGLAGVSADGALVAYTIRQGGADEVEVRFRDVDRGEDLPDRLPTDRYLGLALAPDRTGIFYVRHTPAGPRVAYHAFGTPVSEDRILFGEGYGPDKGIGIEVSDDSRYLLITVWHGSAGRKSEIYVKNLALDGPIFPVVNDLDARFSGEIGGDFLFLQTNWNAPNGRILRVDLARPQREQWREIVPESDAIVRGLSLVGGKVCVSVLRHVRTHVRLYTPEGQLLRELAPPSLGTMGGLVGRWSSPEAFFTFESFHIPTTIYRYDVTRDRREVWARLRVPVRSRDFVVRQVWYSSRDGTRVPMFLLHRRELPRDGRRPVLLTGYGGFNIARLPGFSALACYWAELGGVFAVPNLRGGGEFGEAWHEAGMLARKQNVFDDFIAAAEWLIAQRYTTPERLAISGGSNGGLLVGAAMTQRPDLFRAVLCSVPLLDMLRYHRFLVARWWVPEYGSADDPEQFRVLYAYSPYHRVREGERYPAVMFVTGDADTRVDPCHARKMCALLQARSGSGRPVLLYYDTQSGHSGGKPLSRQIEELADQIRFLAWQLAIELPASRSPVTDAAGAAPSSPAPRP